MRCTHAIVARFPETFKLEKKQEADLALLKDQYNVFLDHLKEAGVTLIELPTKAVSGAAMYLDDVVVAINGTALICTIPDNFCASLEQIVEALQGLTWKIRKTDLQYKNKKVVLLGSDVLYTGKEIFVGVRKHGTNKEGAMALGSVFTDIPVIPVPMSDKALPLKYYINFCADDIIAVGTSKEAQNVLKRIEHESVIKYKKLTLNDVDGSNCLYINGKLMFRSDQSAMFLPLEHEGVHLWPIESSQLTKIAFPFSRFCMFFKNIKTQRGVEISSNGTLRRT